MRRRAPPSRHWMNRAASRSRPPAPAAPPAAAKNCWAVLLGHKLVQRQEQHGGGKERGQVEYHQGEQAEPAYVDAVEEDQHQQRGHAAGHDRHIDPQVRVDAGPGGGGQVRHNGHRRHCQASQKQASRSHPAKRPVGKAGRVGRLRGRLRRRARCGDSQEGRKGGNGAWARKAVGHRGGRGGHPGRTSTIYTWGIGHTCPSNGFSRRRPPAVRVGTMDLDRHANPSRNQPFVRDRVRAPIKG